MTYHRPAPLLLASIAVVLAGCASGSAIVTGAARQPLSPDQVVVYMEPPAGFEVIGLVNASSHAGRTQQASLDYATREIKKQAAQLGANGVLLVSAAKESSTVAGGQNTVVAGTGAPSGPPFFDKVVASVTLRGQAIFVERK